MNAIFYEQREYGLIEVMRRKIDPDHIYKVAVPHSPNAVMSKDVMPPMATVTEFTFEYIGKLPTGELMYLKR